MTSAIRLECQTTARVGDGEWWDVGSGASEVVDGLLHPGAASVADRSWWELTGDEVLDRLLHPFSTNGR